MIEKEPVTVVLSEKGWIRAIRGPPGRHRQARVQAGRPAEARRQGADHRQAAAARHQRPVLHARRRQAAGGQGPRRAVPPDGRHRGERDAVEIFVHEPGRKLLVAATTGHGFIVPEDEVVAMTRKGKQVLNVTAGAEAAVCVPADGRQRRGDRRQPQDADVPARGAARDAARQGRAAAALQGWRPGRRQGVQQEGRADLSRPGGRSFTSP